MLKVKRNIQGKFEVADTFHRYYHSAYPTNPYSLAVHNLSSHKIEELRNRHNTPVPKYFNDDREFDAFCHEAKNIVAHNITFELRHIANRSTFEGHICTMKHNKNIVMAKSLKTGRIKPPKLIETCAFYDIPFDDNSYHSAIFDVTMTLHILNSMPRTVVDALICE